MTKTAHLRVYSPDVSDSGEPVPSFVRSYGLLSEAEGDADWVAHWKGVRMVCPRNLRLRVLESTVAFANAFRGLGSGLVPEAAARAADRELRQFHREHPGRRSHVLTSAWHVPVRWFMAFRSEDREVYEEEGRPRLRLRTDLLTARHRVESALGVLREVQALAGPAEELAQMADWLEGFPDDSMLELDYGDVSELFDPQELVLDDSVDLVARSVEALAEGDLMKAGELYGRIVTRWAPAFSVTFSS